MYRLYDIRLPDGKLGPCATSLEHARREVEWLRLSGIAGHICIEEFERDSEWGAPRRRGSTWCEAKNEEFKELYAAKKHVRIIAAHFDTSEFNVGRKARKFGFGYRIDDPATFEMYRGRWTEREKQLINFMYDEGVGVYEIPQHIKRTACAVVSRLRDTASVYSTRSKLGRFIARGRGKTIHRVLETPSELAGVERYCRKESDGAVSSF